MESYDTGRFADFAPIVELTVTQWTDPDSLENFSQYNNV